MICWAISFVGAFTCSPRLSNAAGHAFTALPVYIDEHEDGSIDISYYQTIIRTLEPGRNL